MKYKQSDIAKEYNVTPAQIKKFRDGHMTDDMYWKEGATIYWSGDAKRLFESSLAVDVRVDPVEPSKPDEMLDLAVIRQCPNPTWVVANLDGQGVNVKIPRRYTNKLVGKRIKVARVPTETGQSYYEFVQ